MTFSYYPNKWHYKQLLYCTCVVLPLQNSRLELQIIKNHISNSNYHQTLSFFFLRNSKQRAWTAYWKHTAKESQPFQIRCLNNCEWLSSPDYCRDIWPTSIKQITEPFKFIPTLNPVAYLKTNACYADRVKYLETSRTWDSAISLYFHIFLLKLKQINILCKNKKILCNHLALEQGNIFVLLQGCQTVLCEPQEESSTSKLYANQRTSHTTVSLQGMKNMSFSSKHYQNLKCLFWNCLPAEQKGRR